jgi:hypothetical protein
MAIPPNSSIQSMHGLAVFASQQRITHTHSER